MDGKWSYIAIIICFTLCETLVAQSSKYSEIIPKGIQIIQTGESDYHFEDTYLTNDQAKVPQELLAPVIDKLIAEDYLEASVDSIVWNKESEISNAYLHVGPHYTFRELQLDSLSEDLLRRLDIKSPRTAQEFIIVREKLRSYYGDNGYPFAVIRLEDMRIEDGVVHGYMDVQENDKIIMDSIIIHGDVKIRQGYLRNYLDIYSGELYNHTKVKKIKRKLDQLTFLKTTEEPGVSFIYDYASLNLYVEPENTSRFDLLFGVIPTNNVMGRQLFLSLDFSAELLNRLGYGEYLFIDFERLRPEQQKFDVAFNYPYLLDTPFAIDASFGIFRNALDFQTVKSNLGVQYLINSTDYLKVAWDVESSRIVDVDTTALLLSRELPDRLSVSQSGLAVEYYMTRQDHRFNPRRGVTINARATGGQRKILVDPGITSLSSDQVDFATSYDTLDLSTPRFELKADVSYFIPILRRGVVAVHASGGWRFTSTDKDLFINEQFQIGGNKLLRGFDEASIFTPFYALGTVEYRLLLSENSYFSAPFVDVAYIDRSLGNSESVQEIAIGIGAGLVFETKVGLFNFSIATGRNDDQGFDFSRPKAHFGFSSLF